MNNYKIYESPNLARGTDYINNSNEVTGEAVKSPFPAIYDLMQAT